MRTLPLLMAAALLGGCGGRRSENQASTSAPTIQFQRASADLVQHGERLSMVLGCSGCHRAELTGEDWSEPGFGRFWTANLTRSVPLYSDEQLATMIRGGARPDGTQLWEMPSHLFTQISDDEMAALIAFLRSVQPKGEPHPPPLFEEGARAEIAAGTLKSSPDEVREQGKAWPPDAGPQHAFGRYIVRATCAECHRMDLAVGEPFPGAKPRPDLRVIVPAYDKAAFTKLMRTGVAAGDREVGLMSEVARGRYAHFTDAEVDAVYAYLQAVAAKSEAP